MLIERLKHKLSSEFNMEGLGDAKKTLGMEIQRDKVKDKVCLSQKAYLITILQKYGTFKNTKPFSTLLAPHFNLKSTMSVSIWPKSYMLV